MRKFALIAFFILSITLSYKLGYHRACLTRLSTFLETYRAYIGILNDSDFKMIVNKTDDDFEDIKRIMQYCHDYGVKQKITDNCGEMARGFSIMAQRNGFVARAVPVGGHWATEVYSHKHNKMVFMDSYFNAYYTTLDGVPVSLIYLYSKFRISHGTQLDRRYYLKKIIYEEDGWTPKYKTFEEALSAIKRYYRENGIIMAENINKERRKRFSEMYEVDKDWTMLELTPFIFDITSFE